MNTFFYTIDLIADFDTSIHFNQTDSLSFNGLKNESKQRLLHFVINGS